MCDRVKSWTDDRMKDSVRRMSDGVSHMMDKTRRSGNRRHGSTREQQGSNSKPRLHDRLTQLFA
jgi:hypothetical protein